MSDLYARSESSRSFIAPKVVGVVANIISSDCVAAIVEGLERNFGGKLDILVNNAAVMEIQPVGSITIDHCQRMLLGNIQTPVMLVEALVNKEMFRPNSRIVNISSDGARRPRKSGYVVLHFVLRLEVKFRQPSWRLLFVLTESGFQRSL